MWKVTKRTFLILSHIRHLRELSESMTTQPCSRHASRQTHARVEMFDTIHFSVRANNRPSRRWEQIHSAILHTHTHAQTHTHTHITSFTHGVKRQPSPQTLLLLNPYTGYTDRANTTPAASTSHYLSTEKVLNRHLQVSPYYLKLAPWGRWHFWQLYFCQFLCPGTHLDRNYSLSTGITFFDGKST